jgi:hypothetical protein
MEQRPKTLVMRISRLLPLLIIPALIFGVACSSSDDDDGVPANTEASPTQAAGGEEAEPTAEPTEEAAPTTEPTVAAASFELADSPVGAPLDNHYKVPPGGPGGPAPLEELPFPPGSVQAHWYTAGDRYVVYYEGLALDGPAYCPGNSLQTAAGFDFITNSPAVEGACGPAATLASEDGAGVYLCDGLVFYQTQIPADAEGNLFGTVELFDADGTIIGLTSVSSTSQGEAPAIDLSTCEGPLFR